LLPKKLQPDTSYGGLRIEEHPQGIDVSGKGKGNGGIYGISIWMGNHLRREGGRGYNQQVFSPSYGTYISREFLTTPFGIHKKGCPSINFHYYPSYDDYQLIVTTHVKCSV
jgi:hypothetical protein